MTDSRPWVPADYTAVLLGVVTLVSGVATGLFSELRTPGKVIGLVAFGAWVLAIGLILWGPKPGSGVRGVSGVAFALTALLLLYAFVTGPRLSERTLVLTPSGLQAIRAACPGAVHGSEVAGRIALSQLGEQFVHIEVVDPGCKRADEDIRIRSEDLRAVLPAR